MKNPKVIIIAFDLRAIYSLKTSRNCYFIKMKRKNKTKRLVVHVCSVSVNRFDVLFFIIPTENRKPATK